MRDNRFTYSANLSIMFTEVPLLERPAAASAAGFDHVEMWWPFHTPVASPSQVDELLQALDTAGVRLTGLNFWAGDMPSGDRGVASLPDREPELVANIDQVVEISHASGCRHFNLLYGQRDSRWSTEEQDRQAVAMIRRAAQSVASIGGTVLLEPLAEGLNGSYPLTNPEQVLTLLTGPLASHPNVALLFDTFHLGSNGVDLISAAEAAAPRIGHVQVADAPGRGEPGSGTLPLDQCLETLAGHGYDGLVACEYKPTRPTPKTLDWITPHT